jgi:hypothetical protein
MDPARSGRLGRRTRRHAAAGAAVLLVLVLLLGCGVKRPPLPPVIRVADPTRDLRVFQEESEAVLSWTYPASTSAGEPLPDLEAVEVWRLTVALAEAPPPAETARDRDLNRQLVLGSGERIAVLGAAALNAATHGSELLWRDDLGAWRGDRPDEERQMLWYAVRSICCRGRESELSNIARLVPEPPPPPPTGLELEPEAAGIRLRWQPEGELPVLVERSSDGADWRRLGDQPRSANQWLDGSAEQGRSWSYRLRSVAQGEGGVRVVGQAGPPVEVAYPDIYPPPPPEDLVCLPEGERVRLRWQPVADAVGYVVTRTVAGGDDVVLAAELATTQFDDEAPPTGSLTYQVAAVDAAGNRSEPATCRAARGATP